MQNKHKVWLYKDKQTGQMKGDGTVTYEDPFSAASAVQWFNNKEFKGASNDPRPCSSPHQPLRPSPQVRPPFPVSQLIQKVHITVLCR